jgi:hypothetical protein
MSNTKNYLTKLAEELADKEASKKSLIEKWGGIMYASGYLGASILGVVGGIFDFAVFYGIIYAAFQIGWVAFLLAGAGAALIQILFGRSAFQLARSLYEGDHARQEYRSTIFSGIVIVAFSLGATLWLSVNTTPIVHAVNEGNLALVNPEDIRARYNAEIADLRASKKAEEAQALARVQQLEKDVTAKGEIRWNSHKAIGKIQSEELPTIANRYDRSIATVEAAREAAIIAAMSDNSEAKQTFSQKVTFGAITIKGINIVINLLRLVLLVAFAMFLTDAAKERRGSAQSRPAVGFTPSAMPASPSLAMAERKEPTEQVNPPKPQPIGFVRRASEQNAAPARVHEWDVAEWSVPAVPVPAVPVPVNTATVPAQNNAVHVRKTSGDSLRTAQNAMNTNSSRITYVNDRGERKEYTRSEVEGLVRKYAKRVQEHKGSGNTKALENNLQKLETFKNLLA